MKPAARQVARRHPVRVIGACSAAGRDVTCALGAVDSGASRELGLDVRVDRSLAGRTVRNAATVASEPGDPTLRPEEVVPSSNADADDLVVAPLPPPEPTPTPTPAPPAATQPAPVQVITQCRSRRRFTIRLRERGGRVVRSATVRVDGRKIAVKRRGRRLVAVIDLRGAAPGTYRAVIRARLKGGKRVRWVRSYRTCLGGHPPSNRLGNPRAL